MKRIAGLITTFISMVAYAGPQPYTTELQVEKVEVSHENIFPGMWDDVATCSSFVGTHQRNKLILKATAQGGTPHYNHYLYYTINQQAFETEDPTDTHTVEITQDRHGNGHFEVEIPKLKDNVPFSRITFQLYTQDKTSKKTVSRPLSVRVSRPLLLESTTGDIHRQYSCFERLPTALTNIGPLSNGSTGTSSVELRKSLEKSWASTHGWNFGVFFSPFSILGFNLITLNYNYVREFSKTVTESVEVVQGYNLNPGDFAQVYVQPTRHVTPFNANLIHPCGQIAKTESTPYLIETWSHAFHLYPLDPMNGELNDPATIGLPPVNTCKDKGMDQYEYLEGN